MVAGSWRTPFQVPMAPPSAAQASIRSTPSAPLFFNDSISLAPILVPSFVASFLVARSSWLSAPPPPTWLPPLPGDLLSSLASSTKASVKSSGSSTNSKGARPCRSAMADESLAKKARNSARSTAPSPDSSTRSSIFRTKAGFVCRSTSSSSAVKQGRSSDPSRAPSPDRSKFSKSSAKIFTRIGWRYSGAWATTLSILAELSLRSSLFRPMCTVEAVITAVKSVGSTNPPIAATKQK
mmetsp:Transcript_3334/g.7693  ORF Transcript_3334/g.7693 Transcript_3334/m.7693 type:complete len:238 (+) Transcript_3334:224-937(+)